MSLSEKAEQLLQVGGCYLEKEAVFIITEEVLSFTDINMEFASEAGRFSIYVGICRKQQRDEK